MDTCAVVDRSRGMSLQVHHVGCRESRRRALTLVELLVSVSILSILAALIVPAVVAARESARAVVCANNLRQAGLFALGAARNDGVGAAETNSQLSKHESLRQCPSDPTIGRRDYRPTIRLIVSPSRTGDSYVIRGAWYRGGLQFEKLHKGSSKTLMYAEVAGLPIRYEGRPANSPLGPHSSHVPSDQVEENAGFNGFYQHELGAVATVYSGMQINRTNRRGVFAFHDGANLLMCDGSVRLTNADTDPECMVAMFKRD